MASRRQRRIAELIHEEISKLLQFETRDPRIGFVTVTGVEVSSDLKVATVYVSLLADAGSQAEEKEVMAGLDRARVYLRYELGQKVNLRYNPELRFEIDRTQAYALKIETLLSEIEIPPLTEDETSETDDGDDGLSL